MFKDWPEHTALVKKSFGELGKNHPKMLQAYGALDHAAAAEVKSGRLKADSPFRQPDEMLN